MAEIIIEKPIGDIVKDAYLVAIPVLNSKTIPGFYDGLKTNQRRIIHAMIQLGADKELTMVSEISGLVIGKYLESGSDAQDASIGLLVRKKLLQGQGNFGKKYLYNASMNQSAPRYISTKLKSAYAELINSVSEFCPTELSEYGNKVTSRFIVPIPIAAIIGSKGIGLAANTNIPGFTAKSILNALLHDDPYLLQSSSGMEIDHEKSNIKKIWEKGHGKLTYKCKVYKGSYDGLNGVFIEADPNLVNIDFSIFNKAKSEDLVVIHDLGSKVFIGKQYKIRKIDEDWIMNKVKKIRFCSDIYMITLYKDDQVVRCSLKLWLNTIYNDYINYYNKSLDSKIKRKKNEIKILTHLNAIGKLIMEGKSDESIAKSLKVPEWVVKEAGKKSINMMRKNHSSTIERFNSEIKELESVDAVEVTNNLIRKL